MLRFKKTKRKVGLQGGFFLAELIVAVFIFGIVMTISIGALITAFDANKKAQSLKSVLNNLNVALETMTKSLATGSHYSCGDNVSFESYKLVQDTDCAVFDPVDGISFVSNKELGTNTRQDDVITYSFNDGGSNGNGFIERKIYLDGNSQPFGGSIRMTASEINITNMKFYITGTVPGTDGDFEQPKVLIVIEGTAPAGPRNSTTFKVQTLVSQLIPDL